MFDFRYTTRRGLREARSAALEFIDSRLRQSDMVALATVNRYGANFLAPFTSDWRRVRAAIESITLKAATDAASQEPVSARDFGRVEAEVAQ